MTNNLEIPKLDLEQYISNYDFPTRLDRLVHLSKASSPIANEALILAIQDAKSTLQVANYESLVQSLQKLDPSNSLAVLDEKWIQSAERKVKAETDRLELELKQYKNNLIKESIRMGNEDLGNHFLAIGNYAQATKCYLRMREYCQTPKNIAELNFKLLYVSILQEAWTTTLSYRGKVFSIALSGKESDASTINDSIVHACTGLAHLATHSFREAADSFLSVDPEFDNAPAVAGITFQRAVISPSDVGSYGALCALATYSREELKARVIENKKFRHFVEFEPHFRRSITMFLKNKFTACLDILRFCYADYSTDFYIGDSYHMLYRSIRAKCIVIWLSAFKSVKISAAIDVFPPLEGESFEEEIHEMITDGRLNARIDLANKLLITPDENHRVNVIDETLKSIKNQRHMLQVKLHQTNMALNQLEIRTGKMHSQNGESMGDPGIGSLSGHGARFLSGLRRKPTAESSGSFMVP